MSRCVVKRSRGSANPAAQVQKKTSVESDTGRINQKDV